MNRNWATLVASVLATFPACVLALGLGDIDVRTSLNEPLEARIPLRAIQDGDVEGMRVGLGSAAQFERAGIERPFGLSALKFRVEVGAGGAGIVVTTREPVVEPFLNFLVEVNWPRGRVIREYTILLDPPVYGSAITSRVRETVVTVTEAPAATAQPAGTPAPMPAPVPAPAAPAPRGTVAARTSPPPPPTPEQIAAAGAGEMTPAPAPARSSSAAGTASGSTYGPVTETDTLWSIADRYRPGTDVSVQQMMLAILDANPEAFSIPNVNALRAGAVLRIPSRDDLAGEDRAAVLREIQRQYAAWDDYRQGLASRASAPRAQAAGTAGAGDGRPAGADTGGGTMAGQDDQARLEVVAGGTSTATDGTPSESAAADVAALRDELQLATEEAEAARQETEELSSRLGEAEQLIGDLQRLIALKDDNLSALQDRLASDQMAAGTESTGDTATTMGGTETTGDTATMGGTETTGDTATMGGTETTGDTATMGGTETTAGAGTTETAQPETPAPEPPAPPPVAAPAPPPAPPPSTLDMLRSMLPVDPVLLGAGLGGVLVLGGGLALMRRRKAAAARAAADEAPPAIAEGESMIETYSSVDLDETEFREDVTDVPATGADVPEAIESDEATQISDEATQISDSASGTVIEDEPQVGEALTEEDPLAEVNVYLAYERYQQAEDLVRGAIEKFPSRHQYRTRLLEVLFAAGSVAAFQSAAREMRDALGDDDPELQNAAAMWGELAPGKELFGEDVGDVSADAVADGGVFDVTGADDGSGTADQGAEGTGLDFDLGFDGSPGEPDAQAGAGESTDIDALDFDLGETVATAGQTGGGAEPAGSSGVDFDLGEGTSAPATGEASGLDFDLGSVDDAAGGGAAERPSVPERIGEGSGLDFDLGTLDSGPAGTTGASSGTDAAASIDTVVTPVRESITGAGSGLDFDLDDGTGTGGDGTAVGEGSALDFDLGDTASTAESAEASGLDLDFDLGDTASNDGGGSDATAEPLAGTTGLDLDFDLADTTGSTQAPASAEASGLDLDFDLGDTGSAAETDAVGESSALDLDFDLGDTTSTTGPADAAGEGEASGLDFDLGDTSSSTSASATAGASGLDLDFDIAEGVTPDAGATGASTSSGGGTGLDLDFELGADSDLPTELGGASGLDGTGLDFDLAETGSLPVDETQAVDGTALSPADGDDAQDIALDFDIGTSDGGPDDAAAEDSLDLVLDTGGDAATGEGDDLGIELGLDDDASGGAGLDLGAADDEAGLDLDLGGDSAGGELDLTLDDGPGGGSADGGIDTVNLRPDQRPSLGDVEPDFELDAGEPGSGDFAVDTEFRGVFGADGAQPEGDDSLSLDDQGTSDLPELDVDLGDGTTAAGEGSDFEATQFMLRDVPEAGQPAAGGDDEDEEDRTLVLGRGMSGEIDEIQTKLDLAQAYIDMDDAESARGVLGEVLAEGDEAQQEVAKGLLAGLG